ncbi:AAA family ATPase [Candidatus Woesearchaeota archaeon]|nr:AAA family ATPase [Candidatus Woesearchaeota archaeon]
MRKIVIGSVRASTGKTGLILGIAMNLKERMAYMKPIGARLVYKRKRLWDRDALLITQIIKQRENLSNITLGFDHSKLKYMYNEESISKKINDIVATVGKGKKLVLIEAGPDLSYGSSVNLDAVSLARHLFADLILVINGSDDTIIDDITFIKKYINLADVNFLGVIINKVNDITEFKKNYLSEISDMCIDVLGILPYKKEIIYPTAQYIADNLMAKVVAGSKGLGNIIKNVFVGALSADAAYRSPVFQQENKLIITAGDRSDMILLAIQTDASAILLTNNIMPPANILAKATELKIPLLLVKEDTFKVAKKIDDMETLITENDSEKIELMGNLVKKYVKLKKILKN